MGCILSHSTNESNSRVECVVCYNEANTVLYPCGHYCLCNDCALQISENDKEKLREMVYVKINIRRHNGLYCPFCRKLGLPTKVFSNYEQDFNTI